MIVNLYNLEVKDTCSSQKKYCVGSRVLPM